MEIILAKTKDDFKLKVMPGERKQSEKLLSGIDAFLKADKKKLSEITGIGAVTGPGRFTSLRIGVTAANILAFGLNVPVAGIAAGDFKDYQELVKKMIIKLSRAKAGKIILPSYGAEPNITIKKGIKQK